MIQIVEMSHEEKVEMYMCIDKERLIEMLIEANNILSSLAPKIEYCDNVSLNVNDKD